MKDEEIKTLMNKYTEAISYNVLEGIHSPEDDDKYEVSDDEFAQENYVAKKREEAHKLAIEVLDKILTPELKVFIRNLCLNRLGYPDDPYFYKVFGDYPQVGDKVSKRSLIEKGLYVDNLDELDLWVHEGNFISKEEIDGETYFVIDRLEETEDDNTEAHKLEVWHGIRKLLSLPLGEDVKMRAANYLNDKNNTPILGNLNTEET